MVPILGATFVGKNSEIHPLAEVYATGIFFSRLEGEENKFSSQCFETLLTTVTNISIKRPNNGIQFVVLAWF